MNGRPQLGNPRGVRPRTPASPYPPRPTPPVRRAEEEYAYYQAPLVTGSASSGVQVEQDDDAPAAVLWVPDIDCRHKWREYYVNRPPEKPGGRAYGFKGGKPVAGEPRHSKGKQ